MRRFSFICSRRIWEGRCSDQSSRGGSLSFVVLDWVWSVVESSASVLVGAAALPSSVLHVPVLVVQVRLRLRLFLTRREIRDNEANATPSVRVMDPSFGCIVMYVL